MARWISRTMGAAATCVVLAGGGQAGTRVAGPERLLVVGLGPFIMPVATDHAALPQPAPATLLMPGTGWLTGFDVEVVDGAGRSLPRVLLHHAELIDPERRDLLRARALRIASVSHDTPELTLPVPLGYAVRRGQRLLLAPMLANPLPESFVAHLRITVRWRSASLGTELHSVQTFNASVPGDDPAASSYDLPAGRSVRTHELVLPVSGLVLALSGHLHEYGERLMLERLATGDTLYAAVVRRTADGAMARMPVAALWSGGGLRLRAGERLRITAWYHNRSGALVPAGGMATVGGLFLPDDLRTWPRLDRIDPVIVADLAALASPPGHGGHAHHEH